MAIASPTRPVVSSLAIAALGCVALTSMIWTVCTEDILSQVFWPGDIQRVVVRGLGGSVEVSLRGTAEISLSWFSVLWRLAGCLLTISALSRVATGFRNGHADSSDRRSSSVSGLAQRAADISMPWTLALLWLALWLAVTLDSQPAILSFFVSTAPLCLAVILAGALSRSFGRFSDTRDVTEPVVVEGSDKSYWRELCVVIVAMLVWEATSFWMNERLYAGLLVPHGDSAMYEEHLWNTWHGKGFRSYLDQGLFLGEHIQIIHLLLLPLHMLWPSYLMMEAVASFSLAICVIPIFSIALRHSGSPRAAMWLALAWLCFFPMHYLDIAIDLKTLRPSCYGMPFLFWGIDLAERRRRVFSSLCLLVALSTQEDFSLIVGPVGAVLFLAARSQTPDADRQPNRRDMMIWSASVALFSVAWLLLAVLVVIPAFRGGEAVHYSRYFGDLGRSPGELIQTALREPMRVLSVVFSFRTLLYLAVLTIPVGLLAWRRPVYLLAGVPTFLMLSLIQLGNDSGGNPNADPGATFELPPIPYHHFHAPLLPIIFWAAAAGLKSTEAFRSSRKSAVHHRLRSFVQKLQHWWGPGCEARDRARFAFFCALATATTGSMMPMGANFWSKESSYGWTQLYIPGPRAEQFPRVLEQLPAISRVASTDYVHTRLTHFERSYDYSNYPRKVNDYQPGVPADTDFIVIDTSHPYSEVRSLSDVRELKVEPKKWEVLPDQTNGLFIILKRRR